MVGKLFGNYYVVPTASAISDARDLFPRFGDYQEARRHALKLAFWPTGGKNESGQIMDIDWEWIKRMKGRKVGELRISDTIGGHNNLRIVFYVADVKLPNDVKRRIWVLSVLDKKSQAFTSRDIRSFAGRLTVLRQREYGRKGRA